MSTRRTSPSGLPRPLGSAFRQGLAVGIVGATLAACGSTFIDVILPPGIPVEEGWQSLPIAELINRDSINLRALAFCRERECGVDSVVGVFSARGDEARRLESVLSDPNKMRDLVQRRQPVAATPRAGGTRVAPKANAEVRRTDFADWSGLEIEIADAAAGKTAYGTILGRRSGETLDFVLVVSGDAAVAGDLARAALN